MKYLNLPFDVLSSATYVSFGTLDHGVFGSECTKIRGYESPCGVMRVSLACRVCDVGALRIPMRGYEIPRALLRGLIPIVTNPHAGL